MNQVNLYTHIYTQRSSAKCKLCKQSFVFRRRRGYAQKKNDICNWRNVQICHNINIRKSTYTHIYTYSEVQQIVSSVNGLLFPGGGADLHDTGRALFKYAIEENTVKGNYFPFWATCLGVSYVCVDCTCCLFV